MSAHIRRLPEQGIAGFIPYTVLALFILISGLPVDPLSFGVLEIGLFLIPVFHIGLYTENDFAAVGLIALGLLNDVLSGAPLGYWAVLFCLLYVLAFGQRQVLQNTKWASYWTSFIVLMLPVFLAGYIIALLRDDMSVSFTTSLMSALVTGLCFPFIHFPMVQIYARTFGQETH